MDKLIILWCCVSLLSHNVAHSLYIGQFVVETDTTQQFALLLMLGLQSVSCNSTISLIHAGG